MNIKRYSFENIEIESITKMVVNFYYNTNNYNKLVLLKFCMRKVLFSGYLCTLLHKKTIELSIKMNIKRYSFE